MTMTSSMTDYKLIMLISGVAGATGITAMMCNGILDDALVALVPNVNLRFAARILLGFVAGVTIWYALSFLRIRMIRLLLSYDHWLIGRPNFIDYVSDLSSKGQKYLLLKIQVWAVCLKLLMNSKNLGIRGYQDMLPTLPVPPLKTTCRK